MQQRHRSFILLIIGVLSLIGLICTLFFFSPTQTISTPFIKTAIPSLMIFFLLIFITSFCLFSFLFAQKRSGFIVSLCLCSYLVLRFYDFTNPFFLFLLLCVLICLELVFARS